MSDYLPPPSASTTIAQLKDYLDFERWAQKFQIACHYKGIWNLFINEEKIFPEPRASTYEHHVEQAHYAHVAWYWQHRHDKDCEAFEKQQRKIQYAMAFLAESLAPDIRRGIQIFGPKDAWTMLMVEHDTATRRQAENKTPEQPKEEVYLKDCRSIDEYLERVYALRARMIKDGGEPWLFTRTMIEILAGLTPEYRELVSRDLGLLQIANMEIFKLEECLLRLEQEISAN